MFINVSMGHVPFDTQVRLDCVDPQQKMTLEDHRTWVAMTQQQPTSHGVQERKDGREQRLKDIIISKT